MILTAATVYMQYCSKYKQSRANVFEQKKNKEINTYLTLAGLKSLTQNVVG